MAERIGFIGLGNMGGPMAGNLARAGYLVVGFDLAPASLASAVALGVTAASGIAEAAADADTIVTMLPAGAQVLAVWREVTAAARPGALLVDCSTIDVASARAAHGLARGRDLLALDAPVSGGTSGASAATLTLMVGGTDAAFARGRPILQLMGKRIVHCGEAGAGQAAKICNNLMLGISMAGVCEAFVLAESLGLSHQALFDVAAASSGQSWALTQYCPVPGPVPGSPANHGYRPGFAAALMLKDLNLAQQAAASPVGAAAARQYALFESLGHGAEDFSALVRLVREQGRQQ